MTLSANGQVAVVVIDTLCCIQYCIYGVTHMQLYGIFLQLISTLDFHAHPKWQTKFQHGEWNVNMAFHPFVDIWHIINTFCNLFTTILQLIWQI